MGVILRATKNIHGLTSGGRSVNHAVGCEQRKIIFSREFYQSVDNFFLATKVVPLDFHEHIFAPENAEESF